jgi:cation diffusion facilitator CzcD-associated flavoprotein CzcO
MNEQTCEVAIIGAGPYGLSAAAHLRAAGVETRVFGEPMSFWERQMPIGMFLRSSWEASHIADPAHVLTLDAYQSAVGRPLPAPVPLSDFVAYGQWFQQQVVPDLDRRLVRGVRASQSQFRLDLEDGDAVLAQRVVVATGIGAYARRPPQLAQMPADIVSHTSEHRQLDRFKGQRVIVVGGGQSAIEVAALVSEAGAEVEVLARAPRVHWLQRSAWLHDRSPAVRRLLYPPTDVGPPGISWIVALPDVFRLFPQGWQERIARRAIRPAASGWLRPRCETVRITTGRSIESSTMTNRKLRLTLNDGTERVVDRAICATGYDVDLRRCSLLEPELLRMIRSVDGYPSLNRGMESSVAGLHFLGALAARSFGPIMRFVCGTGYASRGLTGLVLANRRQPEATASLRLPAAVNLVAASEPVSLRRVP